MRDDPQSVHVVQPSDEAILQAATAFRAALNGIDRTCWEWKHIDSFPRGACGHCAELLAFYLNERFGIVPDYICRDFYDSGGEWETGHAWLEWNGLTIDISGDQFGWPAVIVARSSALHERGVDNARHPWKLDPDWWGQQCGGIWNAAKAILRE